MKPGHELKLALAKLLPEKIGIDGENFFWLARSAEQIRFNRYIFDTEWLHVCWLIEQRFNPDECNRYEIQLPFSFLHTSSVSERNFHASWQQRATAILKVKGIE